MSLAAENVEIVRRALTDLDALPDLLSDDLVWHFYGNLEGIDVDHDGRDNVFTNLWGKLFEMSDGAFAVAPVSIFPAGDELVMAHVNVRGLDVEPLDAVLVYRVRGGRIVEGFDIPAPPLELHLPNERDQPLPARRVALIPATEIAARVRALPP